MNPEAFRKLAAEYAVDHFIESGMIVGLGVGKTARYGVNRLAEHLASGHLKAILGIPCAKQVEEDARRLNIPLTTLDDHPQVDLTFDGADEVDPHFNVIKGGGGALLREKIVAQASQREIIVVDVAKQVPVLGTSWALPVEVIPFGLGSHRAFLESLGGQPVLRLNAEGNTFLTDQGNYILDTHFGLIHEPGVLAERLKTHAGIVEHGLFVGIVTDVIVANEAGITHLQSTTGRAL